MAFTTLHLTSPHARGPKVWLAQWRLKHNRFGGFYKGPLDKEYGPDTALAANRARYLLGYASGTNSDAYGPELDAFLRGPKMHGKRLTLPMLVRRKKRLKEEAKKQTVKLRALEIARSKVGVTESPAGSNRNPFGVWYGLNGEPWCAIFVTYCRLLAGDVKVFKRGERSAWALWPLNMARAGQYELSVTGDPVPGDLVVYTHGEGHIGFFDHWADRKTGHFVTVEGNTAAGNDSNGGAVMFRDRAVGDYMQPHFVRVP